MSKALLSEFRNKWGVLRIATREVYHRMYDITIPGTEAKDAGQDLRLGMVMA